MSHEAAKRILGITYVGIVSVYLAGCLLVASKPEHYVVAAVITALLAGLAWRFYRRFAALPNTTDTEERT